MARASSCLKTQRVDAGVPSVVYTGDVFEAHRQEAHAAGADAYVAKPDIEKLIDTVHAFLSNRECAAAG
jgi:CheY-like chemotaxis protein